MIELLNAPIAKVTVLGILGTKVLAMNAYIVKMVTLGLDFLQNFLKVRLFVNVPWVHQSKNVKNNSRKEEEVAYDITSLKNVVGIWVFQL